LYGKRERISFEFGERFLTNEKIIENKKLVGILMYLKWSG
jgi:hypothetical protein